MKFRVTDRRLYITERETLVAGSVQEYTVEFAFSNAWAGYTTKASFKTQSGTVKEATVSNGQALIPWEVLAESQYIWVGIRGTKGTQVRPTLWSEPLYVEPGAETETQGPEPIGVFILDQSVLG